MKIDEAREILHSMTKSDSLLRHARTVELVMRAMATHFGEDEEKWAITGLLHDADYEMYPDQHPGVIVKLMKDKEQEEIAHAISGHYTKWDVPRVTMMDKAIVAADEITGFIVASCLIRPTRIEGIKVRSVMKKFKTATFAATVDREECIRGAELLGWSLEQLIGFIIPVLQENRYELNLHDPANHP